MIEEFILFLRPFFIEVLPTVFISLILLIFGWVLAKIFKGLTIKTAEKLKIDSYVKFGSNINLSEMLSIVVYWVIFFVFINASIENLGIKTLSYYFSLLTSFIIKLFSGLIVIIIGYYLSSSIREKIIQAKFLHAEIISQIIFIFSLIITVEMALRIIGLPTQLMNSIIIIIVASLGLGLALAIGLGLKDFVARKAKKHLKD